MFDVIVVGELNVDIILNKIEGFPTIGKEIIAENFTVTMGSSSAIFASNLSSLGTKVAFLGKMGKDSFGDLINTTLQEGDVNTDLIIRTESYNTGATVVLNYEQDRAMVTYPGAMEHLEEKEVLDTALKQGKHLHVSSVFLQPLLKANIIRLFKRAKENGLTTSLDPQWDPKEEWNLDLKELLPNVDVFMPNHKEFLLLTASETIEEGLSKTKDFANSIVIKQGDNGAQVWRNGQTVSRGAFINNNVVDCIGAGDSFNAGFVYKFIKGAPIKDCLAFANLAGAINTTRAGGTAAFKNMENIKETAKNRFSYIID